MVHPAILRQRKKNKLIWLSNEHHRTIRLMAREEGCSATFVLNRILSKYFGKEKKNE
jgi:hypothetical protein